MRLRLRYVLATTLAAVLLTAACGSDDDDTDASSATTSAQTATTTTTVVELPACGSGIVPTSLPTVLPQPGQSVSRCELSLKVSGSCKDGNNTGLAITGDGFTPGGQIQEVAWTVDTGAAYLDFAAGGIGQVATNGRIDVRPDGTTRTWDCGTTRSGTADAPGTYALGVLDKDSGDFVLATFTVDTES